MSTSSARRAARWNSFTDTPRRHFMSKPTVESVPQQSGAAGAAKFVGWDSRKYNYYTPKGRKATHYEDMTLDVQPDPKRYLLQDWIISFADGTPTYSETWTAARSSDWHQYRSVDEEWERTHFQRQSTIVGMISQAVENARRSGAPARFDKTWVKVLEKHLGAYKHAEFGMGTSLMHAQRYGYTQMINSTILTNSAHNTALFNGWLKTYGDLAVIAAKNLQPIWSLPHVKVAQFEGAYASAVERMQTIANQLGLQLPASISR